MRFARGTFLLLLFAVLLPSVDYSVAADKSIRIRMGTVAPEDSLWHETLKRIRQDWSRISNGTVAVTIYSGGVLGDEAEMVKQVRQGRIQAVGLSSVGLTRIDSSVSCLQIPMMLDSYEELDFVRDRLAAQLERRIEAEGFKLLNWGDAGWVHSFTKTPVRTPDELRRMKLFTSAGDPDTEELYEELGFNVVPLSLSDLTISLQTGLIDAVNLPPLFALLSESYRHAPNMLALRWTPLVGGTVIDSRVWDRIPSEYRAEMLEAARRAGDELRREIRKMGEDAIPEMQKRGLSVVELDSSDRIRWQLEAEKTYPKLRGRYAPAELFDEALRLRDQYRDSRDSERRRAAGSR